MSFYPTYDSRGVIQTEYPPSYNTNNSSIAISIPSVAVASTPTPAPSPEQPILMTTQTQQQEKVDTTTNTKQTTPPTYTLDVKNTIYSIFDKSNIILLLWFLAIYLLLYFFIGMYNHTGISTIRMIDIILLLILIVLLIIKYYALPSKEKETVVGDIYQSILRYLDDPISIFSTILFLITFYLTIFLFHIPMDMDNKPIFIGFIENIALIAFMLICFIDFFKYLFRINVVDSFQQWSKNVWTQLPQMTPEASLPAFETPVLVQHKEEVITKPDEVFNISNNLYTYDDAQAICKSYGARLATYDDIEKSYNDGAEWCNYGWSDGQMAYFPTQKSTWQKLQGNEKTKNNCGRPGINGGYMANPYLKFGVNCFGQKPAPSKEDLERVNQKQNVVIPQTKEDSLVDKKVKFWKENADKLLVINSFNNNKWSEF
jgi:hypothetical protein